MGFCVCVFVCVMHARARARVCVCVCVCVLRQLRSRQNNGYTFNSKRKNRLISRFSFKIACLFSLITNLLRYYSFPEMCTAYPAECIYYISRYGRVGEEEYC